jgi:hypothetical protein
VNHAHVDVGLEPGQEPRLRLRDQAQQIGQRLADVVPPSIAPESRRRRRNSAVATRTAPA